MTILLFGHTGQLGTELSRVLDLQNVHLSRASTDLTSEMAIRQIIAEKRPELLINAAAYTKVDEAETDPLNYAVNAVAPSIMGEEMAKLGGKIIHFSTDFVYEGRGQDPISEDEQVQPLNKYGQAKLEGEKGVLENCSGIVFRIQRLYSPIRENFVRTMLRLGKVRSELSVIDDSHGSPTSAAEIARLVGGLIATRKDLVQRGSGIYNLACIADYEPSWYEFAREIFRQANELQIQGLKIKKVLPCKTSEYPTPASRPLNCRLSQQRYWQDFGKENETFRPRDWRECLGECLKAWQSLEMPLKYSVPHQEKIPVQ